MNAKLSTATSFLDPLSRFILLPFAFRHLQLHLNLSQSLAISNYGVMMSCFMAGRTVGRNIHMGRKPCFSKQLANVSIILMTFCFLFLGFTSRVSIICMCYLLIGFAGGIIRASCFKDEDDLQPSSQPATALSPLTPHRYADAAPLTLIFAPLLAAWTYNSAATSRYPSLILCLAMCCICAMLLAAYCQCSTGGGRGICGRLVGALRGRKSSTGGIGGGATSLARPARNDSVAASPLQGINVDQLNPPQTFVRLAKGDLALARSKYYQTLQWRHTNGIDSILDTQSEFFTDVLDVCYPHAIQGRTKRGAMVCYELMGKANASEIRRRGLSPEHLVRHFILRNEFIFKTCKKNYRDGDPAAPPASSDDEPVTHVMTILDAKGIRFTDLSSDVVRFIALSAEIMDTHFPFAVERLILCNTPSWFSSAWAVVARVLPQSVKDSIVTIRQLSDLDEYVDPAMRPVEFGGTGLPLREGSDHQRFLHLPEQWEANRLASTPATTQSRVDNGTSGMVGSFPVEAKDGTYASSIPGQGLPGAKESGGAWSSWFGTGKRSGANGPSSQAFLGEENQFYYDTVSKRWVLREGREHSDDDSEVDDSSGDEDQSGDESSGNERDEAADLRGRIHGGVKQGKPMTLEQIEEHGLVLAIQAAHEAALIGQKKGAAAGAGTGDGRSTKLSASVGAHAPRAMSTSRFASSGIESSSSSRLRGSHDTDIEEALPLLSDEAVGEGGVNLYSPDQKPSAELFLLALGMHFLSCSLVSVLATLTPLWMAIHLNRGGLGYSLKDCAVVLSTAGVFIFVVQSHVAQRVKLSLRAFPVRTFRVGVGTVAILCFLFASYSSINRHPSSPENPSDENRPASVITASLWWIWTSIMSIPVGHGHHVSPSAHLVAALLPGCLLGAMVCASRLTRRASSVLLRISLVSVLSSPRKVQHCMSATAAITTPLMASSFLLWTHRLTIRYPMDDSFFLTLTGCVSLFLYICSLLLTVRFRGEFGVLADEAAVDLDAVDSDAPHSGAQMHDSLYDTQRDVVTGGGAVYDVLRVPLVDIRHMIALFPGKKRGPRDTALSARLFSLKVDVKDA